MILVLDTNALRSRVLIRELAAGREAGMMDRGELHIILPTIAMAERWRQVRGHAPREAAWGTILDRLRPSKEPFGEEHALRLAERRPGQDAWKRHARDFLLAAHVHGDRVAVTEDGGPAWEEGPSLTPDQAAHAVRALTG